MSKVEMMSINDASRILEAASPRRSSILRKNKTPPDDSVHRAIEAVTENLFDGFMVVLNPKDHKIEKINDPYCILTGGYGESVLEQDFSTIIPATKRLAIKKLFAKLFSTRTKRPVVEITIPLGIDEKSAEDIRARVYCNEGGIFVLVDKNELSQMQEIEVIRLKALISGSTNSGFWVTDENGIIKDVVSPNCALHLGYEDKELVGMNIDSFAFDESDRTLFSGTEQTMTIRRRNKTGEEVLTEVVQKSIVMSNGSRYILHLDNYLDRRAKN